jgi:hypothetical protein
MRTLLVLLAALALPAIAGAACPPAGVTRAELVELGAAQGVVADDAKRQALALGLVHCLGDPDPFLRDDIAFGMLESWMRAQKLSAATLRSLRTSQLASLKQQDAAGLAQPFAALVLGEVARADRLSPNMSAAERSELVQAGAAYLSTVRDYRGYDPVQGWRHAVAHAADMLMQLARNPALGKQDQQRILAAVAAQLSAASAHTPAQVFLYAEGERLAVPVFNIAGHADLTTAEWEAWFDTLAFKASAHDRMSPAASAHRHNLRSLLTTLYIALNESVDQAQRERVLPLVRKALKRSSQAPGPALTSPAASPILSSP